MTTTNVGHDSLEAGVLQLMSWPMSRRQAWPLRTLKPTPSLSIGLLSSRRTRPRPFSGDGGGFPECSKLPKGSAAERRRTLGCILSQDALILRWNIYEWRGTPDHVQVGRGSYVVVFRPRDRTVCGSYRGTKTRLHFRTALANRLLPTES